MNTPDAKTNFYRRAVFLMKRSATIRILEMAEKADQNDNWNWHAEKQQQYGSHGFYPSSVLG